ncbi:hypothetical protein [Bradyrhizobium sp.]|jgi:hypothetical protein|uniref:hypothetical protein n=1 Tax=Bradyrhizobium sp. TaxID=376 RepID=UPI002C64AF43|nr:hypothetical protein [Bradyrhizobium sp.]HWX58525.1 hypothetical protein [Bradyrhizobium sp.]
MKAAEAALPFERPRLAVVATLDNFVEQMEPMMVRHGKQVVIDAPTEAPDPEQAAGATWL